MRNVLSIIQDVLSTPAIFVGLIAMLGLLLQKKDFQSIIKGTIKTILGFIVLNAGASVVQDAIIPFGDLFQLAFGVHGVVPNNEATTSLGLNELAVETSGNICTGNVCKHCIGTFFKMEIYFFDGPSCIIYVLPDCYYLINRRTGRMAVDCRRSAVVRICYVNVPCPYAAYH